MASQEVAAAKVASIFIYPIKSCRGISVPQAPLAPTGMVGLVRVATLHIMILLKFQILASCTCTSASFMWDRLWLAVNSKGRAYTQRVEPRLALVEVELPIEAFSDGWEPNKNSFLVVRAPGMDTLKIPLTEPSAIADGVSVWEWTGSAFDEGNEASEWFSNFLGKPSRLVRFNEASENRTVNSEPVRSYKIKFADMYPVLLASQGSLDALNDRLGEPIPMNRFRPNILVEGCEPFSEDLWKEISINSLTFYAGELCYRCKIPTINQETAIAGSEPNETLRKFRSDKVLCPNKKPQGRVYFGQMLVCKDSLTQWKLKKIQVGDPVYVHKVVSSHDHAAA